MKKYLTLAATAALVLTGCAKFEKVTPIAKSNAIEFSTYSPKALDKADAANYAESNTLIEDAQFDVYAWYTDNGVSFNGSNGAKFFDWYTVTYKTDGNTDGSKNLYPDGKRYWPSGDDPKYLHFFAYYPSNAGTISAPANGLGDFTFTAEAAAKDQVDFMTADVVKDQVYDATNSSVDGTVALTFKHMLTRVKVNFKTTPEIVKDANTDIVVTKATLKNINNTGKLAVAYVADTTQRVWKEVAGAAEYTVGHPTAALDSLVNTVSADSTFLMVPQTMLANTNASAQYLEIEWDITTDGITTHNTKKLYLDDCKNSDNYSTATAADIDWAKNQSVIYTITIAPRQILFTAGVQGWDDWQTGYFNVN